MTKRALHWFRDDLRLADNPALVCAAGTGATYCIYVLDDRAERRALGGATRWWLSHSLEALAAALERRGGRLDILCGDPAELLPAFAEAAAVDLITWNRRYDAPSVDLDAALKERLSGNGTAVRTFNGSLLNEPWEVTTRTGQPMKVFTPYWRAARERGEPEAPLPAPTRLQAPVLPDSLGHRVRSLPELALRPTRPDWAGGLREAWTPGEDGAAQSLVDFIEDGLGGYADGRDRPDRDSTSRLSPHLRFGEISPRQIWHALGTARKSGEAKGSAADAEKFLSELGWREFSYHLLFHNPDLATRNYDQRFDDFPWKHDGEALRRWQRGLTGVPLVDAGMRQLWTTGWMHNRVRMVAASFLIKHLLQDWRTGEAWFWDTLVDADPANNAASWQWVAGSGADAAPYFRIFNPVTQGETHDPAGAYVRRWIPELAGLPDKNIHAPWKAPDDALKAAGIRIGETYPAPLVDIGFGRQRALDAFAMIRG
ncbi:MAG: deoxyribodipyrimidine photo-lyase [Bosea sp.]|uniref:cryptochrome/photolyase family protein n=1 Tax=unclassified Bosea (in: a-proteobacteria) TaxID=2653178 RepID=UPI0009590F3E|nr:MULTISPECIES: deoxyribodipyrimidine photo-lyase [unclassified Bosea (in: a-proteobacteria)]MBN9457492.1 deoxyribodipyrimidine photo-lyase [Bosea sp. (in: a-proteobacteria)]OJV09545.1 MAG: deoxyribodipyrimidine photolyase [Bosea sp. 67-29]